MELVAFVRGAGRRKLQVMFALSLLAGIANAVLVVVITTVAERVARAEHPGLIAWAAFGTAFLVYYLANQLALVRATTLIEERLNDLRLQLAEKLRQSELLAVDRIGRGRLYGLVAKETNHLSVTFPLIMDAVQQVVLLTVALLYLLYLSPAAFLCFALAVMGGVYGYKAINNRFRRILGLVETLQAQMLDAIADIIHGSKELRLNARRSEGVAKAYRKRSNMLEVMLVRTIDHWVSLILLGSLVTFALLGVVAFGFPAFVSGHTVIVFQLVPVLLFCLGTLTKTVAQSPMFVRAEFGLQSILAVERELAAAKGISTDEARQHAHAFRSFETIDFREIGFTYPAQQGGGYRVGPLSLTLSRGEVVFLVGGNGSGKSTALRMMCGLYPLASGRIDVDGHAIEGAELGGYRELFSAIFVDFHLFDRLYGLERIDPDRVNALIDEMGLAGKVRFTDGRFSQLHLSTGQRKRLALIAAVLEDRPIYVFDEWSAEQDVHFREYFYETFIPKLKAAGKLVIAATHDERYWGVADRVVRMDLGRIEWVKDKAELEEQ